jgi:CubicO group peptidase (beta-lactamase class C family)
MNPFTRYWPATILVTTVLAAQASAGTDFRPATPGSQGMSSEALEALAGLIRGYVEQDTVVGAELVVIKNRRLVFHEAFGHRDREDGFHWTKNTICNIRSMSKCLTGAAAQILIDEGKLGLDDAVAKYLPSFDNDKSRAITIRHLLTHRSGLPLTIMDKMFGEYESLRRIADLAGERGPDFEPGSDFQYSDTGSDVLGAVIEVAAEQTLQAYMKEHLLKPLRMRDTLVYNEAASRACTGALRATGCASGTRTTTRSTRTRPDRRASTARRWTTRNSWPCGWTGAWPATRRCSRRKRSTAC